jgi:hypothetical protein
VSNAVLALVLTVAAQPIKVGEPVPIAVELRNVSDHPVWVAGVLDGSEDGIRYPHYRPEVRRAGRIVAAPPRPEDPLVAPLRAVDFRLLQPGEAFDPTHADGAAAYLPLRTFVNFRPDAPGSYELALTFSTESAAAEDWLGRFGQEAERDAVLRRVAEVPRVTLTAAASIQAGSGGR